MTQSSLLPILTALLFTSTISYSQRPTSILYQGNLAEVDASRGPCNDAGTVSLSLTPGSQSTNPMFLCFGDSLTITHNGDQDLSGDPNPATVPGIGYAFYKCPPTVGGGTLSAILGDPCIYDVPVPPSGIWVNTGVNPNGNTTFINDGYLQDFFNGGAPVQIWFAPITVDHFYGNTYEEASPGAGAGPCVDVNLAATFSVVYLNPVRVTNLDVVTFGVTPRAGSFVIEGGRPEFDGSTYTISIYQKSNPAVTGIVTSGFNTHGSTITFQVPNASEFVIEVTDDNGCGTSFNVFVPSLVLEIPCVEVEEGTTGCVDVVVQNFIGVESLQLFFHWDPAVASFVSISASFPSFNPINASPIGDSLLSITHYTFPGDTLTDGSVAFTLCFKAVGNPGDCTRLFLKNRFDGIKLEAILAQPGGNDVQVPISSLEGCICIIPEGTLKVQTTITPPSCPNIQNAAITLQVAGGTPPYQYNWTHLSNGAYQGSGILAFNPSTITFPNLIPGLYSITVTDSENPMNVVIRQIQIAAPPPFVVSLDGEHPRCFGDVDGYILATVSGGTGDMLFNWSTGAQGPGVDLLTDLGSGTYSVTVTDENQCTAMSAITLYVSELTIDQIDFSNITCSGGPTSGRISVQGSGGTIFPGSDYTYNWSPSGSGNTLTNLGQGSYFLTVSDDNGCTVVTQFTITAPQLPVIESLVVTNAGCQDKLNGQITAQVTPAPGGSMLQYNWSGPGGTTFTGQTITGLGIGNYFLTVTDNNGCSATAIEYVGFVFPFSVANTFITPPSCTGGTNGSLGLQMTGGTAPFSFTWSNIGAPSGNSVNAPIPAGTYTVTITDAEGCGPEVLTLVLPDPPAIVATINITNGVSCNQGLCDGGATATAAYADGTSGLFNYTWSSGETQLFDPIGIAVNLCSGNQSVTISDGNCYIDTSFFMPSPDPLVVQATVTDVRCSGETNGQISVDPTGGTPAYLYVWTQGDTTQTAVRMQLPQGSYQVTVIDNNGCIGTLDNIIVNEPSPFILAIDAQATSNVRCAGEQNGTIVVNPSGGNAGTILYQWSVPGGQNNILTNLNIGTYSVTATDSKGCSASLSHTLTAPPPIVAVIPPIQEPDCFGESTLISVSSATGGNGLPFTYSVDNSLQQPIGTFTTVFAGQGIRITIYDALGCAWDTLVNIGQPAPLFLDLGQDIDMELGDSVTIRPLNDLSTFNIISYLWNPAQGLDCPVCERVIANPGRTTTYTMRIEDAKGCSATDQITINVRSIRRVFIPTAFTPNFDGFNDNFTVHVGKGVEALESVRIFDRWGNQIYERLAEPYPADGTFYGWDGTFRGKLMDPGVYVYSVEIRFTDGQKLVYRGEVNIVR